MNRFRLLIFSIILILSKNAIGDELKWDYSKLGPDVWGKYFPDCNGDTQSPINIKTECTVQKPFESFSLSSNFYDKTNFTLRNDGHTITSTNNGPIVTLTGGDLNGNFVFKNFHLHWGPNENVGSEHQVNGVKYTGESHFVFQNLQTNQYAVLAFFMKNENNFNENDPRTDHWKTYFDSTQILIHLNDTINIYLNLSLLMLDNLNDFWRYDGSLTIPPCTKNVIWTIFRQPISIFNYEFDTFRDDLFFESYRGPQNLYSRKVYRSFENDDRSNIPDQKCCQNRHAQLKSNFFILIFFLSILLLK